jgi:hypothetical protein
MDDFCPNQDFKLNTVILPDTKKIEAIKFEQIQSISIRLFEIELKLANYTRTINLDNLQFEDLRKVKEKFERISRSQGVARVIMGLK